jgi:peptidyl-prolyl cis-trans isomerase D
MAAEENGLKLETSKPFSRFIQDPLSPLPQSLIQSMFKAKTGGMAMAGYSKGYAVARLKEIERARPEANAEEYKNIGSSLKTAIANDIVGQFTDALRQRYDVSIDRRAVEAMF